MLGKPLIALAIVAFIAIPAAALGGEADVIAVDVTKVADGTYRFDVTVRHADEGWDHCADRWDVVLPDGSVAGARTLYHPHVSEQPFKRSLSGVQISEIVSSVVVRAHDSEHGLGGVELPVAVPH